MSIPSMRNTANRVLLRSEKRRPAGVSRRQRRQFLFETLEDRRVMSASTGTFSIGEHELNISTISSSSQAGQLATLQNELFWQALATQYAQDVENTTFSIPTDPFVDNQWHLINSGQQVGNPDFQNIFGVAGEDINVAPAWIKGYTGEGVVVAVIDSGVETAHPDLAGNIDPDFQFDALERDGDANPRIFPFDPNNPFLYNPTNAHGTSVAGLIAAEGFNGIGGTGVAHNAQIVPIRLIDAGQFPQAFVDTFRFETDRIDITNNSWGPGVVRGVAGPSPAELLAVRDSIFFGRDGLGQIHLFASGNSGEFLDSANYNGWVNSRYTIGVTGVDHDGFYNNVDGTFTAYPEAGTSILVAGPTGSGPIDILDDTGTGSGLLTTDTTGNSGFNINPDPVTGQEFDRDFLADEGYTSRFNGTSASTPTVAGVVALMLEANPNLNWRDVQEILLRSARQNAKFATGQNGLDRGWGLEQPNTWIINPTPVFHDPDEFDPAFSPFDQVVTPTLDPNLSGFSGATHYAADPHVFTNGAGYTISQGVSVGYGYGVVDADMAVALAEQWHSKGQALPDELTFTTAINSPLDDDIPAAEMLVVDGTNTLLVPGGLFGDPGFIAYWQEYFTDDPFADFDDDIARGFPLEVYVPDDNAMVVENLEIRVNISGGDAEALDHLRIVAVSPNGTHSELNRFFVDPSFSPVPLQADLAGIPNNIGIGDPGSVGTGGNLVWTFSTNRNWGERSDKAIIFDPGTMEPILDDFGFGGSGLGLLFPNTNEADTGTAFVQGWQFHFENYGNTALNLEAFEIAWHGRPINPQTKRVQGLIGVDDNQDDLFNYSRVITGVFDDTGVIDDAGVIDGTDLIGETTGLRLGDVQSIIDETHESMGANVTVTATRLSDGLIVDQFVTGNDGNFYFDLLPDDYRISIEDPLGRTALDDSLTPGNFLLNYQAEWIITEDYFQIWDYDSNLEVPINPATGAPFPILDIDGEPIEYNVEHINFLLDPGAVPPDQVEFTGVVFADANGDGAFNADDILMPSVAVFGDVNRNGEFDAGEPLATTALDGSYTLLVETLVSRVIDIGVIPPLDWAITNPVAGIRSFFVNPGERETNVSFAIQPTNSAGDGGNGPGIILGTVFDDANGNAARDGGEGGVANQRVYLDLNRSGVFDAGDRETFTNDNGAYVFTNVSPGSYDVRVDIGSPFVQTLPFLNRANDVTVNGAGTTYPVIFGVENSATLDYGDLPPAYGVTLASENGARHSKGIFFLGQRIDAELDGQPSSDADGDDLAGEADEDGIAIAQLPRNGGTVSLTATASRHGGYLKAWMDFNNNGSFDDPGERIVFTDPANPGAPATDNRLLGPGATTLEFTAPPLAGSVVYARFRYGEQEIDSVTGFAQIGEVEDYALPIEAPVVVSTAGDPADFDGDGSVTGFDFLAWQRGVGMTSGAGQNDGDATADGAVNGQDLAVWEADFTPAPVTATAPATGDYNLDGRVVGGDFLTWQRGVGTEDPSLSTGDGTGDGEVDDDDLFFWEGMFGVGVGDDFSGAANGSAEGFGPRFAISSAAPVARNAFVGLAPTDVAVQQRLADVVFGDANVVSVRSANSTLGLLRRDRTDDEDLFSVTRELAFAEREGRDHDHDEVFARLPQAFYEK
ncbi:S8 family serine peptidase [Pirellulales bacterium]|nr:S8 family serine peptidase [Pirellulales bacterium]